ncbi:MAG: hypothetical protein ACI9S9_004937, partial [Planctomycetota bacterium]
MNSPIRRISLALLTLLVLPLAVVAQDKDKATPESFPPRGWKAHKVTEQNEAELDLGSVSFMSRDGVLQIKLVDAPAAWPEAVAITVEGRVVARCKPGEFLKLSGLGPGEPYKIYVSQPEKRIYHLIEEAFVEMPSGEFPAKGYMAHKSAVLKLTKAKQACPKNITAMMFGARHEITFTAGKTEKPCLYLLCQVQDDGKETIRAQSLTSALSF